MCERDKDDVLSVCLVVSWVIIGFYIVMIVAMFFLHTRGWDCT